MLLFVLTGTSPCCLHARKFSADLPVRQPHQNWLLIEYLWGQRASCSPFVDSHQCRHKALFKVSGVPQRG